MLNFRVNKNNVNTLLSSCLPASDERWLSRSDSLHPEKKIRPVFRGTSGSWRRCPGLGGVGAGVLGNSLVSPRWWAVSAAGPPWLPQAGGGLPRAVPHCCFQRALPLPDESHVWSPDEASWDGKGHTHCQSRLPHTTHTNVNIYIYLNHSAVYLKLTQSNKATMLQLKYKKASKKCVRECS